MDRLDGGHDTDPRPADPDEVGDLALDVHPHLEDQRLVVRPEPEDRQREADLVVLVALVLERPVAGREDGGDGLLRRGLGDAPGDPQVSGWKRRRQAAARACSAGSGRVDPDDAHVADRGGQRAGRLMRGPRPAGGGPGQVVVAVGALAGQGDEQVARADPARIDGRAADRTTRRSDSCPPVSRAISAPSNASAGVRGGRGGGASVTSASVP